MADSVEYLVTGAGGGIGSVSRSVVELLIRDGATVRAMIHREDDRADAVRALGAHVVVGDLTEPQDVVSAMRGVKRMFFNMSVSPSYLKAATIVCAAARENGGFDAIVSMSQMTVSQMTLTSTAESRQHRLHWLAEQVMDWSGLPVTHVRPTVFIDNPLFTFLNAASVRERHTLVLPFGTDLTDRPHRRRPCCRDDPAETRRPRATCIRADRARDPGHRRPRPEVLPGPAIPGLGSGHALRRMARKGPETCGHSDPHRAAHRHHGQAAPRRPVQPRHQ
jgi:uncharacterized protein YbjT (DUF2867 family)